MSIDLSNYVRVAQYDLPEPTRTTAPSGNLLGQEASGVTYNWDTNTLFVVGDGGTSVTEVSLTGALISTMTLATGSSPQGTEFYDIEGITYVGNGQFVFTEERYRQVVKFTYAAGTTLTRANAQTVDLGTDIGNIGNEGLSYDPQTGGFIVVKELQPQGIFQTNIDFAAGTATNGSSTTVLSTNLFDPALAGLADMSDVYALSSNSKYFGTTDQGNLLILSQESGKVVEVDRAGNVLSSLTLQAPVTPTGLNIQAMTVEGITVGPDGTIYIVSEEGGGDFNHPQLWVYRPASEVNTPPTGIALANARTSIVENTNTGARLKVADINLTDDGIGTNNFTVSGADAALFEADSSGLYIKAGTTIDYETKTSYSVTVNVDDPSSTANPDASVAYTLNVTNVVNEGAAGSVAITEAAPWSSGIASVGADWFELTNTGNTAIDLTGWKMDDSSFAFGSSVALNGVTTLAPGESVIFLETATPTTTIANFVQTWFNGTKPANLQIGTYTGSGVGLGTGGDGVAVFNASGVEQARVSFGAATTAAPFRSFDNSAVTATVSTLSTVGVNGAFAAANDANEIGSPGTAGGIAAPVNTAPTAIGLSSEITQLAENTSTAARVKVANVLVTDDGLGTNTLALTGADAAFFEVDATGLYLKAGTQLNYEAKSSYAVTVTVDDTTIGNTPDASVGFTLTVNDVVEPVRITEVAPWSSGNGPVGSDWFEITNTGSSVVDITGWKMDDNSFAFANAATLSGVTSLAAGESAIFLEIGGTQNAATVIQTFINTWFGGTKPAGLQIGTYSGAGLGLSTGGDGVAIFDAAGNVQARVTFGASTTIAPLRTFDNAAGLDHTAITQLSSAGTNGAFIAPGDTTESGSPGISLLNAAPVITSNGGGDTASILIAENSTTVITVEATDANAGTTLVYSLSGTDATLFNIDASTGVVTFKNAPNFEAPVDAGGNNVYDVVVNTSDGVASDSQALAITVTNVVERYTLQLLHLSDGEAGTLAPETAPYLAALADRFEDAFANSITLAGGDTFLPGPFLAAGTDPSLIPVINRVTGSTISTAAGTTPAPGVVDTAIHNLIGVEASGIGNHEWDLGSNVYLSSIAPGSGWVGANYASISANLVLAPAGFTADPLNGRFTQTVGTGTLANEEAQDLKGRIAPSAVINEGGQTIGLVGVTTQILESISSPTGAEILGFPFGPGANGETNNMALLAAQLQPVIDDLRAQGVNKIVLLSHLQQITFEKQLAPLLKGVDIILAAGSNTRLGDADDVAVNFPGHAADFADTYPLVMSDADGKTTLIVNTDNEYTYLGRLVVDFDENGDILLDSVTNNAGINGAYASTAANVAAAWNDLDGDLSDSAFAAGTRGNAVKQLTDAVDAVIEAKDGNIYGYSNVYLEGERIQVRNQETNLGNVSADANADVARDALGLTSEHAIVSIKNGGGIRAQIGTIVNNADGTVTKVAPAVGGEVSQLDVENALRFDNKLMVFDTTAQGLLNILNSPNALAPNNGGFIQIGGVRFSYDPTKAAGARVQDVVLVNELGDITAVVADNGVVVAGAPSLISVVALNFTANGGDGYLVKSNATNFRYLLNDGTVSAPVSSSLNFTDPAVVPANAIGEQQAFAEYFSERYGTRATAYNEADTVQALDTRIQNQAVRSDTVLVGDYLLDDAAAAFAENDTGTAYLGKSTGLTGTITYSLTGADAALFDVSSTGVVTFKNAPNFEAPADGGANNVYDVRVVASNGTNTTEQDVAISVTNVNEAPAITSNGGGDTASLSIAENVAAVTTVTATDPDAGTTLTYAITGGADAALFQIDAATGALSFRKAPNFERAADAGSNNVYEVIVSSSDGTATDTQTLSVTVTDVADTRSSQTPYLVSTNAGVTVQAIITTGDATSKTSGGTYLFGGIPDGLGMFDNGDGTVTVLVGHELAGNRGTVRDHGAIGTYVSQLVIDKTTLEVISGEDAIKTLKIWDAASGTWQVSTTALSRFCSADLAPQNAFYNAATGLGTQDKIFLTGEESGVEGKVMGVVVTGSEAGTAYDLSALGKFSHENAVANGFATQNKTIVMGTDDGQNGQVYVYVGTKQATGNAVEKAGLAGGKLYGIKVANLDNLTNNNNESNTAIPGGTFSLVDLGDVRNQTGAQLDAASEAAGVTSFLRPEDIAWDPTNPARGYFVTTNSFGSPSRLYQFTFTDISQPELGGTITAVLDGTEGQQMLDNITVDFQGKVILQEDVGNNAHLGKVWQYDPVTDTLTQLAQHDPARFLLGGADFRTQDEESSGVIDVTATFGDAHHKAFLLTTQNHAAATGPNAATLVEGGQLQLIKQYYNDAPKLTGTAATLANGLQQTTYTVNASALLAGYTDANGDTLSVANLTASNGTVTDNGNGTFTITPNSGFTGTMTLSYQVSDGLGGLTAASKSLVFNAFASQTYTGTARADTFTSAANANWTVNLLGGNDVISLGAGNDVILVDPLSGYDTVSGGLGIDTIRATANGTVIGLSAISGIETISSGGFSTVLIEGTNAGDTLDFSGVTLSGITLINGSNGNDTLTGSTGDDTILGGTGNDTLDANDGNDTVDGGTGNDIVRGGAGNDTLTGGTGNDELRGGAGNDTITGGTGNDTMFGDGDDDTFIIGATAGRDTIDGGTGNDTVVAAADGVAFYAAAITNVEVLSSGGFAGVTLVGSTAADAIDLSGATLTGIERISGGAGADTITGSVGDDTIDGGTGNDNLNGGDGDDVFLIGLTSGKDTINGGTGTDTVRITADNVALTTTAWTNIEVIDASGQTGARILGGTAADTLNLAGVTLTNIGSIDGGAGNDTITGSAGNDTMFGGVGADLLAGGGGDDRFVFRTLTESRVGTLADRIADFATGDLIDLSGIDANANIAGIQNFTFIGSAAFTGLGQLRVGTDNGKVALFGNISGTNTTAEFEIILDNNHAIIASDLVLI